MIAPVQVGNDRDWVRILFGIGAIFSGFHLIVRASELWDCYELYEFGFTFDGAVRYRTVAWDDVEAIWFGRNDLRCQDPAKPRD